MKKVLNFLKVSMTILILIALVACNQAGDGNHWKPLFDGKTLTGWHQVPGGKWTVENGIIIGTSPKEEERHGILLTDQRYRDFKLRLKFKALKGNSGLYFRVDTVDSKVSVNGFQAEIDEHKDIGGLYETGGRAWVVQPSAEEVKKYFKVHDWNEMILSAIDRHVEVYVNGVKTAELLNDPGRLEGHIGLQLHGHMEMHVMFKDIEIQVF
jgi:hypothetical protein